MCSNFEPPSPFNLAAISATARLIEGEMTVFESNVTFLAPAIALEIAASTVAQEELLPLACGSVKRSES